MRPIFAMHWMAHNLRDREMQLAFITFWKTQWSINNAMRLVSTTPLKNTQRPKNNAMQLVSTTPLKNTQRPLEQRNATGVYHTLEEHLEAQEQRNATGVYHILEKHPGTSDEEHPQAREQRTATGVYHTLEEDPETQEQRSAIAVYLVLEEDLQLRIGSQSTCGYRVPKGERGNNPGLFRSPKILKTSTTSVSQRLPGEYNCLDFSGNSVICDRSADDPDKVYSRLKEGTGGHEESIMTTLILVKSNVRSHVLESTQIFAKDFLSSASLTFL